MEDNEESKIIGVESRNGEFLIRKDYTGRESIGCCACTITDTDITEFRETVGRPGPWYDADFFAYVARFGWFALTGLSWAHLVNGAKLGGLETLRFSRSAELRDNYAYVVVECRKTGKPTSVVWDGYEVLDPDPEAEQRGVELRQYNVLELYFLDRWTGPRVGESARK